MLRYLSLSLWYGCGKVGQIEGNILVVDKRLKPSVQEIICRHKQNCHKLRKKIMESAAHSLCSFSASEFQLLSCHVCCGEDNVSEEMLGTELPISPHLGQRPEGILSHGSLDY